jgi:Spy/CpxP family protein refolding chaperone
MRLRRETFVTALCLMALLAVLAAPLAAQGTPAATSPVQHHQGMMMQRLATKLNLTDDQQTSAKALFQEMQTKLQPLHQAQKQLNQQLKAALGVATPDAATVGQAAIALHQNRAQMKPIVQAYHQQFEALLNPDQLASYKQMLAAHSSFRHSRGGNSNPTQ